MSSRKTTRLKVQTFPHGSEVGMAFLTSPEEVNDEALKKILEGRASVRKFNK